LTTQTLSIEQARRIALFAQGFVGKEKPAKPNWATIEKTVDRLHLLQIDSVNVLARSHYLPLFSRLGNYDRALLDKRSLESTNRTLFECWAHEASFVPLKLHPLMRWRMERAKQGLGVYKGIAAFAKDERKFLNETLAHIRNNGPVRASEIPGAGKSAGGWWGWSKGKLALEVLFTQGLITASSRLSFERFYDVTERVIPSDVLDKPLVAQADAQRLLIGKAAEALGVGTEFDFRDYFRLPVECAHKAFLENVEDGTLVPVSVEGWKKPAFMHRNAKVPKAAGGNALLTPFDPVVWYRDRTERLFNFHYRLEFYTPAPKRKYGYYVLPFLMGSGIAGRFCVKADREGNTLRVNASHMEKGCDAAEVSESVAGELAVMAQWLDLADVEVVKKGNLAGVLKKRF
jgi:uncharacterized protein YcaQ